MAPARFRFASLLALLLAGALVRPAAAAWPNSPLTNLPLSTAANDQSSPQIVPDGAGGAIVTWQDFRNPPYSDIYAQHVLASGVADPAWPADGRALCTAANSQSLPQLVSDGAGGAIVTWYDLRNGANYDIYAQHVLASGVTDPAWPAGGRALCVAAYDQFTPTIVSDGAGGAIVTWYDTRSGTNADIYAQHVLASGAVDPAWPADGRALCTAANSQSYPQLVSDGAGGAIVTWSDYRSGSSNDVYAQHVLASGAADPAWPTDGRALCTAAYDQSSQTIVPDGAGGAIVTWSDYRSGANYDIYAQHVLASGAADPAWPTDGRALCTLASFQVNPGIVTDGARGAIVTWQDFRNGANYDIYAQHVLASGVADPAWPADGRALCAAANHQYLPTGVSDGAGGAIVTWYDVRGGANYDIYAQHVLVSGAVDPAWPADGRTLCTAAGNQAAPTIIADGAGGAIVTWHDGRGGSNYDVYAQRVARFGYLGSPEPEIVGVKDVANDQGGRVKLSWNASYPDLTSDPNFTAYDVLRSVPTNVAAARLARGSRAASTPDEALRTGADRLLVTQAEGQTFYWEFLTSVSALHYVSGYSYVAPTTCDSLAGSNPKTAFMVVARNTSGYMFWPSRPDSGYSVDNLAPTTPAPFTGQYAAGTATLHWDPNPEGDLAGYRLHRGSTAGFVPGPGNLVAALADTGYVDNPGAPGYYKLCAVDAHGNLSTYATLLPAGTLGVDGGAPPAELVLARPSPNPAAGATTLRFALPRAANVVLAIHDVSGRRVRLLVSGAQSAGEHSLAWDLRDDGGRAVGAGVYFVRIAVEGQVLTRRLAAVR